MSGRWVLRQQNRTVADIRQPVRRTGGEQPIEHVPRYPRLLLGCRGRTAAWTASLDADQRPALQRNSLCPTR